MDLTATAMARDNNIGLIVFDIQEPDAILRAIEGNIEFTEVTR